MNYNSKPTPKMKKTEEKIIFGRFKKRKTAQSKKGLFLVVLLIIALLFWSNAENIMNKFL